MLAEGVRLENQENREKEDQRYLVGYQRDLVGDQRDVYPIDALNVIDV